MPIDDRAAQRGRATSVPVSGGTLLLSPDTQLAFASDPERDRVSIVDVSSQQLLAQVALESGDEPGRMAMDVRGVVHVVLRRGGAIASIDPTTHEVLARRAVCVAPRGVVYDVGADALHVACSSGELVTLSATPASMVETARVQVDADLRDAVMTPRGLFVTRGKRAELLGLDSQRQVTTRTRPKGRRMLFDLPDGSEVFDTYAPTVARRTIPLRAGYFAMLHQGSRVANIPVERDDVYEVISAYAAELPCNSVVTTELTVFDADALPHATVLLMATLAVDLAASPLKEELSVAVAGTRDLQQPGNEGVREEVKRAEVAGRRPAYGTFPFPEVAAPNAFPVLHFNLTPLLADPPSENANSECHVPTHVSLLPGPATAIAYLADGRMLAQTREPAALWILDATDRLTKLPPRMIDLEGERVYDTGHELFHRDAGGNIACASCHFEGADDGHIWHFIGRGARRTPALDVDLEGTAPFYWAGDMTDIPTLMDHVFVGRMGGPHQTPERVQALERWLYALPTPTPLRAADDAAAVRGKALFDSEAECGTCHSGPKLTDNTKVDVGTGLALQVPSLVGVSRRGPWMHDGCATTLTVHFDAACGGDTHGRTKQLTDEQRADLIAYLETL
ncbi:MAG: c-type cytochrome [Polyangiales bacterium]